MGNISTKINLAAFKNSAILKMGQSKVDCIIIPIEQNHLYKSEKGAVYLDLIGFEIANPKEGQKDTHLVKQSINKDILAKMSEEEQKSFPILGNHINWDKSSGTAQVEQGAKVAATEQDLPF